MNEYIKNEILAGRISEKTDGNYEYYLRGEENSVPSGFINELKSLLKQQEDNPSGVWADYNILYAAWNNLTIFAAQGLIPADSIPNRPNPSNYTDLSSEATLSDYWQRNERFKYYTIQNLNY